MAVVATVRQTGRWSLFNELDDGLGDFRVGVLGEHVGFAGAFDEVYLWGGSGGGEGVAAVGDGDYVVVATVNKEPRLEDFFGGLEGVVDFVGVVPCFLREGACWFVPHESGSGSLVAEFPLEEGGGMDHAGERHKGLDTVWLVSGD